MNRDMKSRRVTASVLICVCRFGQQQIALIWKHADLLMLIERPACETELASVDPNVIVQGLAVDYNPPC